MSHLTAPSPRPLGLSGLNIAPLVFGGNVFGWTVDQPTSFALLDRFVDAGLNAIDTADVYSAWVPGNQGGESETIIGQWLKARPSRRDQVVLITKVGAAIGPITGGLKAKYIAESVEGSLRRLHTDHIDLYLSHYPDPATPAEETLRAYDGLIRQGKVRAIGASNHNAAQLRAALDAAGRDGLPRYTVIQPEYNLYDRASYEGPLRDLAIAEGLGVITYYSLASGFLSGKYRSAADLGKSVRGEGIAKYLDARGLRILDALDGVARKHQARPAEVALAWLIARAGVSAPIASATSLDQLDSLIRATRLTLDADDLAALEQASAPA
ncbi:aldo/keto reductase [Pseudothauera nasutitermitis]|uniref:Aldo/keto reductase n=1 Tax=Pseudothauera nasutitermitis TaxID=2565930 RepID=A0A4V3WCB3_9RHOO|nr:aldo/keto reductase [Pseudothauera nasutitermitis]THF66428.1 aldo/keto reductase [Pseudothauera nasutitermitis]